MSKSKNQITRLKLFFDVDKDLEYINQMNKKGWKLVYIKLGCFYTFVKTEPDEYTTIIYSDEKQNIASITAFAAQCGYESIPHTNDGMGELVYFTGKKSVVSNEFVSESKEKASVYKRIYKKYLVYTGLSYGILLILLAELFYTWYLCGFDTIFQESPLLFISIFGTIFFVFYFFVCLFLTKACLKLRKKIKGFKTDQNIYE